LIIRLLIFIHYFFFLISATNRNYCFTLNLNEDLQDEGPATEFAEALCTEMESYPKCKFVIFQLERGEESGLLHLQGYCELTDAMRFTYLKTNWPWFATAHFERRQGTAEQAIAYCQKEETRIAGPWSCGQHQGQGFRSDMAELSSKLTAGVPESTLILEHTAAFIRYGRGIRYVADKIRKIRKAEEPAPESITVIVLWGESGSGKTETAKRCFPGAYTFMPQRGGTTWWPDYQGEETIIIDEFANNFQFHYALRLINEYGLKVETKGDTTTLYAKTFVITAMEPPTEWWPGVTTNRVALYRRITHCYRLSGRWPESTFEIDRKPFEYDNNVGLWRPDEPEILEETNPEEIENLVSLFPMENNFEMPTLDWD